jgi:hypothetical protein
MAWNHRSRVVAMAVALQATVGVFVQPSSATDLMAVASPTNTAAIISADDNTATGTVWENNRVYLGKQSTLGATIPLRGPGGVAPPASNAWPVGRIMQSAGWAEIRNAAARTVATTAAGTATTLTLAASESSVDDFLLGAPIQHAALGSGFQQTSIIRDYVGSTKTALLAETIGTPPASGTSYTIPMYLSYVLGTLTTPPPVLSISIWRDKKRYDYRDWTPASLAINIPVANEANTGFPDITFSGRGTVVAIVDDVTPTLPSSILQTPVAPARNGKFYLDRVKLGHQSLSFTEAATIAAASNQNQAAGQDGFDIISGTRTTNLDINQMAVADFDLHSREDNQSIIPVMSTWGMGPGNNFGFVQPNIVLNPFSPGDRNGYVSLTGDAITTDVDKSAALTIWY